MPKYVYTCASCFRETEGIRRIADRHKSPVCDCGSKTNLTITATAFVCPAADFTGYRCVATGQEITSERQRKEVMKEHGLADAREFGTPDWDQLEQDRGAFHREAEKPMEAPAELRDALKREGKADLLSLTDG